VEAGGIEVERLAFEHTGIPVVIGDSPNEFHLNAVGIDSVHRVVAAMGSDGKLGVLASGYRFRHEDEKNASAILIRIFPNPQVEASASAMQNANPQWGERRCV
jgi:hypothetical protein